MKPTKLRSCWHCNLSFLPDPRVGDRQVTCGAAECKHARHTYMCKQWHLSNPAAHKSTASQVHYQDAVKPFRLGQPSYQRRWRLAQSLREIREQILLLTCLIGARLRGVVARGQALLSMAHEGKQTGVITQQSLPQTLSVASALSAAIEQVAAFTTQLTALGL